MKPAAPALLPCALALLAASAAVTLATPTAAHAQSRYVQISRPIRGQELAGPKFLLTGRADGDDSVRIRIYDYQNRLVYNGSARLDGPTWRVEPSLRNEGSYRAEVSLSRSSSVRDSVTFRVSGDGGDDWSGERLRIERPRRDETVRDRDVTIGGIAKPGASVRVEVFDTRSGRRVADRTLFVSDRDRGRWETRVRLDSGRDYRVEAERNRGEDREEVRFRVSGDGGDGDDWTGERLRIERPRRGETVGDRRVLVQGTAKPGSDIKLEVFDTRTGRRVSYQMLAVPDRGRGRWETRVPLDPGREYRIKVERNRGEDREELRFRTEAPPKMPR